MYLTNAIKGREVKPLTAAIMKQAAPVNALSAPTTAPLAKTAGDAVAGGSAYVAGSLALYVKAPGATTP